MKKVSGPQVVTTSGGVWSCPLPAEIQQALSELVGAAREGLLALSASGLGFARRLHELMEAGGDRGRGPEGASTTWTGQRSVTATRPGR